jgi:hypothetical protein
VPRRTVPTCFFIAWSISSTVSRTVVLTPIDPLALIATESAAAVTLSGSSAIPIASASPKLK